MLIVFVHFLEALTTRQSLYVWLVILETVNLEIWMALNLNTMAIHLDLVQLETWKTTPFKFMFHVVLAVSGSIAPKRNKEQWVQIQDWEDKSSVWFRDCELTTTFLALKVRYSDKNHFAQIDFCVFGKDQLQHQNETWMNRCLNSRHLHRNAWIFFLLLFICSCLFIWQNDIFFKSKSPFGWDFWFSVIDLKPWWSKMEQKLDIGLWTSIIQKGSLDFSCWKCV